MKGDTTPGPQARDKQVRKPRPAPQCGLTGGNKTKIRSVDTLIKLTRSQLEKYKDWLWEFFDDNEDDVVCHFDNDETRRLFLVETGVIDPELASHYW